jgi:L-ascorbate metabolism protein UlaG (beta-lactamase superfamily)
MRFQFLRHSTMILEEAGSRLLIDPMLSAPGALPPLPLTASKARNPLIPLPIPAQEILRGKDAVLISHAHFDHFDEEAARLLDKGITLYCQPRDYQKLRDQGFTQCIAIEAEPEWGFDAEAIWKGIRIHRFDVNHGSGIFMRRMMGPSSAYLFEKDGRRVLYSGDTVYDRNWERVLHDCALDILIANAGEARFSFGKPITLGYEALRKMGGDFPNMDIYAIHMDAISHCGTRAELRTRDTEGRLRIPEAAEYLEV